MKSPTSPLNFNINEMKKKNLDKVKVAIKKRNKVMKNYKKNVKQAIKNAKELQKLVKQIASLKI